VAGRIRTIKPEVLDDEIAAALPHLAWRLWVSSWLLADDQGNFRANPNLLLGQVFWATPTGIEEFRQAVRILATCKTPANDSRESRESGANGLWLLYRVKNQPYAHITGWDPHQRVDRPGKPRCPGPELADEFETYENSGPSRDLFANNSREVPVGPVPDLRPTTSDQYLRPTTSTGIAPVKLGSQEPPPVWNPGDPISSTDDFRQAIELWGWVIKGPPGDVLGWCSRIVSAGPIQPFEADPARIAADEPGVKRKPNYFLEVVEGSRGDAELAAAKPSPPPRAPAAEFSPETQAAIDKAEAEDSDG
jgi:hypothetical protein